VAADYRSSRRLTAWPHTGRPNWVRFAKKCPGLSAAGEGPRHQLFSTRV